MHKQCIIIGSTDRHHAGDTLLKLFLEDTIMKNAKWIVAMLMAVIMLLAVGCASEPADTAATPATTEDPAEEAPAAEAPAEDEAHA